MDYPHDIPPQEGTEFLKPWIDDHACEPEAPASERNLALLYGRRSLSDVRDVSIGRQVATMVGYCETAGLACDIDNLLFIDRHRSGKTMDGRVSLHAMRAAVRTGKYKAIVVESLDRLARNLVDALIIKREADEHGVEIHVANRGPVDTEMLLLYAYQAETERELLVDRMRKGMWKAAAEGRMFGSRNVYGFVRNPRGRGWSIDEAQAAVVRDIFDKVDRLGWSLNKVVMDLNRRHIPSPRGSIWSRRRLWTGGSDGLMANKLLKGVFVYGARSATPIVLAQPHLAIIEPAQFDRVNARLQARTRYPMLPFSPPQHLLRGVVRCTRCGTKMSISKRPDRPNGHFRRVSCPNAHQAGLCKQTARFDAREIDRRYLLLLKDEVLDADRLDEWNALRLREWEAMKAMLDEARAPILARLEVLDAALDAIPEQRGEDAHIHLELRDAELEHHKLGRALATLDPPPLLQIGAEEAAEFRDVVAGMLLRLPFEAYSDAERGVVARLHLIMPRIVIGSAEDGRSYHLEGLVGMTDAAEPSCPGYLPGPDRWISRQFQQPGMGFRRNPEVLLALHGKAEDGVYEVPDAEWALVQHLYEPFRGWRVGARGAAGALVMLASTGIAIKQLPERYAYVKHLIRMLRERGVWRETVRLLGRDPASTIGRLDPGLLEGFVRRPKPAVEQRAEEQPG